MSTQQSKVANVPRLDINPFKLDKSLLQRLRRLPNEFEDLFEHLKFSILIPLSWFLTMFKFIRSLVWGFLMLPVRLFINFYERRVRQAFPLLPSIWGTLFYLFPEGITFPTFTSLTAGPFRGAGPIGKNPTMDIDLDAIINGTNGEAGGHSDSVGTGSGDPSTQVNINPSTQVNTIPSKLETALKKIPTFSPADLNAGLEQVTAAQAEVEKALKLTDSK